MHATARYNRPRRMLASPGAAAIATPAECPLPMLSTPSACSPTLETCRVPVLLVAAPASGQGKTTITAALARLHARQGLRVRVFKTGRTSSTRPCLPRPAAHQCTRSIYG